MTTNPPGAIPTTLFTGFLGSGKTTIILDLIDQLQASGQQTVYIKNEIGEADVDAALLRGKNIQTRELLNGCICCTLVGPFTQAIDEVIETVHPDRILIEASGTAQPAAIALMISSHKKLIRDGVLTIIDAVNFEGYADLSISAQKQAEFTDLIIFNKVELATLEQKQAAVAHVRELNQFAPIVEAKHGHLPLDLVFGCASQNLETLLKTIVVETHQKHESTTTHHAHVTHDDEELDTFPLTLPPVLTQEYLHTFLENLPKQVFRVKGFAVDSGNKQIVVNKVGNRITLQELSTPIPAKPLLVCIGFHIGDLQESIQKQLLQ